VRDRFSELCRDIGESDAVTIDYASAIEPAGDPAPALAAALEAKRMHDLKRGLTQAGPHRDDVAIALNGRDLRTFGSAGQQRSAAIALRMLEAATFTERLGRAPVFLLDDPFAELDVRRAARILAMLTSGNRAQQIILAVPRESDIPSELTSLDRARVTAGSVARLVSS